MVDALSKIPETPFGEEIPPIKLFTFDVTSRCNMNCNFCFQRGREYYTGPDMKFEEFKKLIDQIKEQGKILGNSKFICIAGGEPFLNKEVVQMSQYAVRVLGRKNVSITTNLALFPTNPAETAALLKRMGLPRVNVSIDREHLLYGREMEARIIAFFAGAKAAGAKANVQNVAQTKYQEKYRWPKNIARLIPKEFKTRVAQDSNSGRREFYSSKKGTEDMKNWLGKLHRGEGAPMPPINVALGVGLVPLYGAKMPVTVHFATDGKAYLFSGLGALHAPQFSIGSWKRETLKDIIKSNLPYKINVIKGWLGMVSIAAKDKHQRFRAIAKENPKKVKLFAGYALKRFEREKKQNKNRLPR
ncbi:MAG: radical SAM protein [archaeon]